MMLYYQQLHGLNAGQADYAQAMMGYPQHYAATAAPQQAAGTHTHTQTHKYVQPPDWACPNLTQC
jgi:hypothetical protein